MKTQVALHKGSYVVCKFRGSGNGDIVCGRIASVRRSGIVEIEDVLLERGHRRKKRASVFAKRNVLVTKRDAMRVRAAYLAAGKTNPLAAAREAAVRVASEYTSRRTAAPKPKPADPPPTKYKPPMRVTRAVVAYENMTPPERVLFAQTVWGDVLNACGVH